MTVPPPLLETLYASVQAMVEARMSPINRAFIRLHLIDGIPAERIALENHAEPNGRWRDVLTVAGKPVFEVRSGFEGPIFKVCPSWLDGRDIVVTAWSSSDN